MKKVLVFGAASAIASNTVKMFARDGAELFLVDLSLSRLEAVKKDVLVNSSTTIHLHELNVNDFDKHQNTFNEAIEKLGGLDAVLVAHGTLPDQEETQLSAEKTLKEFSTNCTSTISLLTIAANIFEKQKNGRIAVISSVAGDRGRQSIYIYGAAKGALTIFLQGLRNRLDKSNVSVLTVKPGFVDTPMTAHLPKNPLYASAEKVGQEIYKAMKSGKDVVYIPGFWRLVMFLIKHIPEKIFKKLSL